MSFAKNAALTAFLLTGSLVQRDRPDVASRGHRGPG